MSFRAWGVVASAILLATLATGCASEPPTITAPELSESDAVACRALVDALPDTLAGLKRVDVAGDSAYGAAWGDPAIVLTCGVGQPADFTDGSTCIEVDRAGWYVPDDVLLSDDESLDVTTTEMNYRPRVQLVVPGRYRPEGFTNSVGALTPIIDETLERSGRCL